MTVLFCTDDKNGLLFGGKRQSKDRRVRERILKRAEGHTLWMSTYSSSQFEEGGVFIADDDYPRKANGDDYCFAESADIPLDHADRVIIYRWNRHYPATAFFKTDLTACGFSLTASEDFAGYSHETITEEIYEK